MMLTLFASVLFIKGVFSLTVIAPPSEINVTLKSNSSIVLSCTYRLDINETIDVVYIQRKTSSGVYNKLVKYTDKFTLYANDGEYLRNRSDIYGFDTGSFSAVLVINDVRCEDDGQYQFYFDYVSNKKPLIKLQNTIVYIHADAEKPIFSINLKNSTEEHDMVNLSCSANVGNPQGLLEIWRKGKTSQIQELLGNTSAVYRDTESCTSIANLTVTYNLTRQDNGAMFRCSSRNKYSKKPFPAVEVGPIGVLYAPFNTTIHASGTDFLVGANAELKCFSDGNPSPDYKWMFNLTEIVNSSKYIISGDKSKLTFTINITDNGNYQCVSSNHVGGQVFNSSSNVMLTVQEKNVDESSSDIKSTCSRTSCSFIQSCALRNGSSHCSLNIWSVIAFVFIALTVISGAACVSLILSRKPRKKINQTNGIGDVHISYTRENFEDFGGYADPKDVKRPENGPIKSDNPYADPVDFQTQYAVVQKNWMTPTKSSIDANSSNSSNMMNNTDSSNTGNPSSSSETTNPKNSSSDEKTPGSTETSETIPKPPNVDQSPTKYINLLLE